jgi:hypothetical protein
MQDSNRNNDKAKYQKDAKVLTERYGLETDSFLKTRYAFYAAQSYRDSRQPEKAIEWYTLASKICTWDEEIYISKLNIARLQAEVNKEAFRENFLRYAEANQSNTKRLEAPGEMMVLCRKLGWFKLGYSIGLQYLYATKHDGLFVERDFYNHIIKDELSVFAYKEKDFWLGYRLCSELIESDCLPAYKLHRVRANLDMCKKNI